jgi:hypothetical protein
VVRAIDTAGNIDTTPASYIWTIDIIAPETTITATPQNPTSSSSASFSFTSTEPGSFQCQLDGGGYATCTSPQNYTNLGNGSHTFEVRAIDALGNFDPTPASYAWTIDMVAPDTSITAAPANLSNSSSAGFSFTSTEPGSFQCQLDAGNVVACSSPQNYTGLGEGSHAFQVRAIDSAGNIDPSPASYTWTVDTIAPETTLTATPDNPSTSSSASFNFTSSDAASFQCRLDGTSFAPCVSPQSYSNLAQGSHTFQVQAIDQANNIDPTPASYTWTYAPVTGFPAGTTIEIGTLRSGGATSLNADDNNFFQVNSTTSGTLTTSWYASFTGVSSTLSNLKITYKGRNSRACVQTISVRRWTDSTWVQLDSRTVGPSENLIANLTPTGPLANYVSPTGNLEVQVYCARNTGTFFTGADLMMIVYDVP